ncbi:Uncharacterised protein [Halioglobus japonicus]|nr:Uncharacterised protein [Halioglobus japonicus]
MHNPLWEYSLATYRVKGVAASCLALQDSYGIDVNLLLYAAWLAQRNEGISVDHLTALDNRVTQWRDTVVKPLRALRCELRTYPQAAGVREELKALELRAEREQQDMMHAFYEHSAELAREVNPTLSNLTHVAHLASPGNRDWEGAIRHLAALVSS